MRDLKVSIVDGCKFMKLFVFSRMETRVAGRKLRFYNDHVKLIDARTQYFRDNDFGEDGGYSKPTATVYLFGKPVAFPNTEGRKKAVVFHDLHHILTGYKTNNLGEAEISAWELGSGCFKNKFAWVINTFGLCLGIFKSPSRVFGAFVRGRHSQNVYGRNAEQLLGQEVAELRDELGLSDAPRKASPTDWILFSAYLGTAFACQLAPLFLLAWLFL